MLKCKKCKKKFTLDVFYDHLQKKHGVEPNNTLLRNFLVFGP